MDFILFQKINFLADVNSFFDGLIWFFAYPFGYILTAFLALALIWPKIFGLQNRLPAALALVSALFARYFVKNLIVLFYNRPRPFDILEVNQLVEHGSFGSFPSGHAIFFFTLTSVLVLYNKKLGGWFFAGAILIAFSRIAAGLHWPSDIIFGASLGILIGVLAFVLAEKILKKQNLNKEKMSELFKS